ncbi:hypothetical protein J3R83DRAFT_13673 [Lanmaoa asiatica]|nr:hypothetical protein J3R83DRAFT_13673 [Lanmaoa asiatica]
MSQYHPSDRISFPSLYAPLCLVLTGQLTRDRLYGLTLAQTWYYFHSFPKDSYHTKILIEKYIVRGTHRTPSTLGTAQIVLVSASIYQYTIVWAGDIVMSGYVTSYASNDVVRVAVLMIAMKLCWQRRTLARAPHCILSTKTSPSVKTPQWQSTRGSNSSALIFYLASIACDLLIAGSQAYLFQKSRTGIGRHVSLGGLITRLTILVVNVGLLTSIDVTVFLVLFLVCPSNGAFLVPYILMSHCKLPQFVLECVSIIVSRCYSTDRALILPVSLNSRLLLRELVDNDEVWLVASLIILGTHTLPSPYHQPPSVGGIVRLSEYRRKFGGRFWVKSSIRSALPMSIPEFSPRTPHLDVRTASPNLSPSHDHTPSPSSVDPCPITLVTRV